MTDIIRCETCKGEGFIRYEWTGKTPLDIIDDFGYEKQCPDCGGSGVKYAGKKER